MQDAPRDKGVLTNEEIQNGLPVIAVATPRELSRRLGVNVAEFGRARKLSLLEEGVDYKVAGEIQEGQARRLYKRDRVIREWPRIARILRENYMRTPADFRKWFRESFGPGRRVGYAV